MRVNLRKQQALTAETLRKRVFYDPQTGKMIWRRTVYLSRLGCEVGCISREGYRGVTFREGNFRVHRLAWLYVHGEWPDGFIDHINGIRTDNRIANLRVATHRQNLANRPSLVPGRGMKGITRHRDRWQAQIYDNGKNIYLGRFDTAEEAHAAYAARAVAMYGEFARLR